MTKERLDSFSILEALRPPPGYRTTAALGTTYSADIVACLATVLALDGTASDNLDVKPLEAVRAIERQRRTVRIACQQGRLVVPRKRNANLVALLDRIVRPVRCDASKRSFHPKVWLVRQSGENDRDRFVLVVGSRNLTRSQAWEMGVVLRGGYTKGTRLDGLTAFAQEVCARIREPSFWNCLGDLDSVRWEMPPGVLSAKFGFEAGRRSHRIETAELLELPPEQHVWLISPFVDSQCLKAATDHFKGVKVKAKGKVTVVGGRPSLDQMAKDDPELLGRISPLVLEASDEDDLTIPEDPENAEVAVEHRSLHAKIAVVRASHGDARVIIGSPNMTARAWDGRNVEAYLCLRCRRSTARSLEAWFEKETDQYVPSDDVRDEESEEEKTLEKLKAGRDSLANTKLTLIERNQRSTLRAKGLAWDRLTGLSLAVTRLTQATRFHHWLAGRNEIGLPPCEPGDRTEFVLMRLACKSQEFEWVQTVHVLPRISETRDGYAVAKILKRDGFALLRAYLGKVEGPASGSFENSGRRKGKGGRRGQDGQLFLEDLLRRIAHAPDAFKAMQRDVDGCSRIAKRAFEGDEELQVFWRTWRVLEKGMEGS